MDSCTSPHSFLQALNIRILINVRQSGIGLNATIPFGEQVQQVAVLGAHPSCLAMCKRGIKLSLQLFELGVASTGHVARENQARVFTVVHPALCIRF